MHRQFHKLILAICALPFALFAQDIVHPNQNKIESDSVSGHLKLDMTAAVIPTSSRLITCPYGIRATRMHRGVDIGFSRKENRIIVAAFDGKVKLVRNQGDNVGFGKYIILDHGNGFTTLYAHLDRWKVKIGNEVHAGDTIGIGGSTGASTGPHLHFEMHYNDLYIDPANIFNFKEGTYYNSVEYIDPSVLETNEKEYQRKLGKRR